MLIGISNRNLPRRARGFGLIEMMVAIVVGLIVIGGAINLVVAINQANNDTIQSTRLTQELQALASVIADEIKRARRVHDPYAVVGTGVTAGTGSFDAVNWSAAAGCIVYGYQDPTLNDTTQDAAAAVNNYRAIYRSGSGNVLIASGTAAVSCTSAGVQLNTPQIRITGLEFKCGSSTATSTSCSEIDLTLTGQLTSGDTYSKAIIRKVIQPIFVRSGAT